MNRQSVVNEWLTNLLLYINNTGFFTQWFFFYYQSPIQIQVHMLRHSSFPFEHFQYSVNVKFFNLM